MEIFVLQKFRVLNFCVKIFSWSRIPTKIFDGLNRFYVPRFGDLERDNAHQENVEYEQFAACSAAFVATTQLLANYSRRKKNRRLP